MSNQKAKIHVLGHNQKTLQHVPERPFLQKVDLSQLTLPIENTNDLAENRIFLVDESFFDGCPEYVGFLTNSYDRKYSWLLSLGELDEFFDKLEPNKVFCAEPTNSHMPDWFDWTVSFHKTIRNYLDEMSDLAGMTFNDIDCFWANNFVCHKSVLIDFIRFAKPIILEMTAKYGNDYAYFVEDKSRVPSYLFERLTMLYFSNRSDLEITPIPKKNSFLDETCWISSCSENYKNIASIYFQSLKEIGVQQHRIKHTCFYLTGEKSIGFRSDAYVESTRLKVKYMLANLESALREEKKYKYFIFSDCDVQYFPDRESVWRPLLRHISDSDKVCWFAAENATDVNTGVIVLGCDHAREFIDFYTTILDKMSSTENKDMLFMDQSVVNDNKTKLKFGFLPAENCILGSTYVLSTSKKAIFHHPINTRFVQDKIDQLRHVRALICNFKNTIFVYKNYKKSDEVLLSMRSLRHFMPYVDLYCLNLYDESESEYADAAQEMAEMQARVIYSKKDHGDKGSQPADSGFHVIEYVNKIQKIFQTNERVVILDETNYFLTGETLRTLMDSPWDLCYGFTFANNLSYEYISRLPLQTMSHKTIAINFNKFRHLFPLPEVPEDANIILGYYLIETARSMRSKIIELRTRNHYYWEGDGTWTDNISEMRDNLQKAGIL